MEINRDITVSTLVMYKDYGGFDEGYFRGVNVNETHDAGFSNYDRGTKDFESIAKEVEEYITDGQTVYVAGCAFGYTVEELQNLGVDSFGADISEYAVKNGAVDDIIHADVAESINREYDVAYIECMLSCLTDQEAQDMCIMIRDKAEIVIHRLWDFPDDDHEWYNVKSKKEWKKLCDPNRSDVWL